MHVLKSRVFRTHSEVAQENPGLKTKLPNTQNTINTLYSPQTFSQIFPNNVM